MIHPKPVLGRETFFVSLAALILVILSAGVLFLPSTAPPVERGLKSEKSKFIKDRFGYPDKFQEYFADIEGLNDGYAPYPPGHKMREFQKAILRNAKRGYSTTTLKWVERGPGQVGGRSRAIVQDLTDASGNTWYVASVGGGVWKARRSQSFGLQKVEWTPLTDHLPSLAATTLDVSQSNPNVVYFGTGEGFRNIDASFGVGMFKSTDKGETWTHLTASTVSMDQDWRYINRLVIDPDNPDIVVVATNGAIFRTENGGESFEKVYETDGLRVQDLKVNKDNFKIQFAAVNRNAIIKSTDGGKTWEDSFTGFVYGAGRIELAISESHPEVIWASVEGLGGSREDVDEQGFDAPIADLYRSVDNGNTWRLIEFSRGTPSEATTFLGLQGWFDNSIAVHPFSPDTVYIGGIFLWKAWVNDDITFETGGISRFDNSAPFLDFTNFGATFAGGQLEVGYLDEGAQDITRSEMTSVQVRFGPGLTQMAHRYTVPPQGGADGDGGAGITYPQYRFADYVEVPFQVWDTDSNRQLMVSFRDQANDGEWSLIRFNTDGSGVTHSREYVFISKYDYNASEPRPEYKENGGFSQGLMYNFWPALNPNSEVEWDPISPQPGILNIDFGIFEGQYRSTELWEKENVHVDHHAITVVPIDPSTNEFHIFNANDGGVAFSLDGGEKWFEGDDTPGFNTAQFYDATKHPDLPRYFGGTQDNGTWLSGFSPSSRRGWPSDEVLGGDGFDVIWKSTDSLIGSIQYNLIAQSVDGGKNWFQAGNIYRDFEGQFLTSIGWTPKSKDALFSISPDPDVGLLRSLDFGEQWDAIRPPQKAKWGGGNGGKVRVSLANPNIVWAGYRMTERYGGIALHVSDNALSSLSEVRFQPVTAPSFAPSAQIAGLATHPFTHSTAYVTFGVRCQPKVLRTEDMGNTWEDLSGFAGNDEGTCESTNGFPDAQVWDLEVFPDIPWVIWAATDMGIFESRNHGQTWAYADNGLPAVSVWRIRIVDDEVVLATHGRGIWSLNLNEVQTDIERVANEIPDSFELLSNYPNPFNPSTTVSFKVATQSHIRLTVFDMLGRKVATLTDQPYTDGIHQVEWDASAMASGQYIYRMEANDKLIGAKAMMLIK
ncbi:MAG: T9SS type A sorting domain-containing protein [Bacteroidota bacterium]|nr:T9SS type A sorting domain-containing protein [Bacteroidota bacterium]MXW13665.1 T9SS type A sorting domain-containing protein [Rhodothermaceae bacterium]MXW33351.1 T9SS type A sorting domain-containing protein [Rhodothermaceae bacterium]MYC05182.1 T9SS type A sorting domain-containing protein [Rhodothermaceae bacterium]MYE63785.1 T9SS type A sorting domain-containing protein [Rhodothermaceae bacterium]